MMGGFVVLYLFAWKIKETWKMWNDKTESTTTHEPALGIVKLNLIFFKNC